MPSPVARLMAEVEALRIELAAVRAQAAELARQADVDPLLGLLNRRGFERELKRSLAYVKRYGTPAALVYLDLDGLKRINDTYGHAAGDALLQGVAAALIRNLRASDVVGRLGGDEIAFILWNVSAAAAAAKAAALERIVAATEVACVTPVRMRVGASAGVAVIESRDTPANVLDRADRAMYARKAARQQGRG
jgi:diguanylate cyclase (GGDEF)-like protein